MTPKQRAEKSAHAMWQNDKAAKWFGMQLVGVDEDVATISLEVQTHHANGHGICHGGVTFALADTAFAFACNSRNQATVAQHNSISYIGPVAVGDTLTATATQVSLTGRSGVTDVIVTNQSGDTVALFRGASRAIRGTLFDEATLE